MNEPYKLFSGEGVWATIECRNKVGNSLPSDMGNDAKIPHPPGTCLNLEVVGRTANSIQIEWTEARDYDDILFFAPITRYEVQYQERTASGNGELFTEEFSVSPTWNNNQ
jgi:hypothetical protein